MNLYKKPSEKEWLYNIRISSPFKIIPINPSKNIPILIFNKALTNFIAVIHQLKYSNWNSNLPSFMLIHWSKLIVKKENPFNNNKSGELLKVLSNVLFFSKAITLIMGILNPQLSSYILKQGKLNLSTHFSSIMANQLTKL